MSGIYTHIPFCKQACYYCDFHFSTDTGNRHELVQALVKELVLQKDYLDEPVSTVYFGGGTPSMLNAEDLAQILSAIRATQSVVASPEITLEANPDDLTPEKLKELRAVGINRLSIGIQSFDDALLLYLNRVHNAAVARESLDNARSAGFGNISIDLIYAMPGLSNDKWIETLKDVLRYSPEHLSTYSLTIEERTVFGNWKKKQKLTPVPDEVSATQFEIQSKLLSQAGYEHYEISNFAKPGFYSRHNSNYWKRAPYLGIGPGAHSFNGESRQANIRNNALYIRSISTGQVPCDVEILSRANKVNEYLLTTLRTVWGCDLQVLETETGDDLLSRSQGYIEGLQENKLAVLEGRILKLTQKGMLLADRIAEDLMLPG
jgi:oxygen-independent coproporphyrinogen-3 oxidase